MKRRRVSRSFKINNLFGSRIGIELNKIIEAGGIGYKDRIDIDIDINSMQHRINYCMKRLTRKIMKVNR